MNQIRELRDRGQSLWLDNISQGMLRSKRRINQRPASVMTHHSGDAAIVLAQPAQAGIDADSLAPRPQHEDAPFFVGVWRSLPIQRWTKAQN